MRQSLAVSAAIALLSAGCAGFFSSESGEPKYSTDPSTNFQRGESAFKGNNWVEAEKYFQYVKDKYPYLAIAREAELRLSDSHYAKDRFIEARDAYANFAKLHPSHPRADYAAFRAALTHYREIPSNFFIFPPIYEKDQVEILATRKAMDDFVQHYPQSPFVADARKYSDLTKRRQAEHEMYVASFYERRKRWGAVAGRLETVVRDYPGLGLDQDALFRLHKVYSKMNDRLQAQQALRRVIDRFPGTKAAEKAQKLLGS